MIAPAMNTRQEESLPYRDLARQRARISRQISLEQLRRIEPLTVALDPEDDVVTGFEVEMAFSRDPDGLVRVAGDIAGTVGLICNGCAEALAYKMMLGFDCIIVDSDAIAAEVTAGLADKPKEHADRNADVVVAQDGEITIASLIEDEILLGLPERLCTSSPCPRAPELFYPGEEEDSMESFVETPAEESEDVESHPFSVLAQLKTLDTLD
jgi:uncharacterized metal-binding protein YceD (DUF177 family)